jgi:hypothetical protein
MRKLYLIGSALVLGIGLILSAMSPVTAAPSVVGYVHTERNVTEKQADSVYWGTGHVFVNLDVKKYSDGTIDGHVKAGSVPDNRKSYCTRFDSLTFPDPNTAVFVGLFEQAGIGEVEERYTLIDNGEPAIGNSKINIELYLPFLPQASADGYYSIFTPSTATTSLPEVSGAVLLINHAVINVYSGG